MASVLRCSHLNRALCALPRILKCLEVNKSLVVYSSSGFGGRI